MRDFFNTSIEFLKGVGSKRAELLASELNIRTFGDLIQHYPFRYEDRTRFYVISELHNIAGNVQVRGKISSIDLLGAERKKRLVARFTDESGQMELVWFKMIPWLTKTIKTDLEYVIYGKPTVFNGRLNIAHPEIEPLTNHSEKTGYIQPVYNSTEKLKKHYLDSKSICKLITTLLPLAQKHITETLPKHLIERERLVNKSTAILNIHQPANHEAIRKAHYRLKFEEFFYLQLRLITLKMTRLEKYPGRVYRSTNLLTKFYNQHLPFELTGAQKRVIREVFGDLKSGKQMNRLIQGDVGSGKTIVAFICMLIIIANDSEVALMAPTEILAEQHYKGLSPFASELGLEIAILTGSTSKAERKRIEAGLENGRLKILIGTHALLEDTVNFKNLGLVIIDEQHRFGVAQRAKLWKKNPVFFPHIMVMTATPIPRTLAMTLYGDLDISVIDELPAGRKEIITLHKYESHRLEVFGFIRQQLLLGSQAYIVYPLIEESEKLDLKHLTDGYEAIKRAFPEYNIGMLHGKMKSDAKDFEMNRFVKKETKILVATTVIEVGVNVPNATIMLIENAERFGLSQLHQLRGRVGRGGDQSYCILMTEYKISKEGRQRINTMVRTTDGFEIAEVDLKLRGPGDLMGTQQSGILDLLIADITKDAKILELARSSAIGLLQNDPELLLEDNKPVKDQIESIKARGQNWSRIS